VTYSELDLFDAVDVQFTKVLDHREEAAACLDESLPLLTRPDITPAAIHREVLEQAVQIYES